MRHTLHILVMVVLLLATRAGRAAPVRPEPVDRSVGRIPSSAEMVVVVDGLAATRRMPAAAGVFDLLSDLRIIDADMTSNWKALATLLGWTNTETLDRLLGSRVVLIISSLEKGTPWAVMSEISNETDQRIKETIPIAPRKSVEGIPVIALERGDYEMATIRAGDDRVMLLLGPAKRAALFDTMVRSISKGIPDQLSKTPVVRELAGHTSPGILLAVRLDTANPDAARHAWDDFIVCTATPRDRTWDCKLAIRDADMREYVRRVEPSSDAPYRAISRNAILAVLERRLAPPGAVPANIYESILALFALPKDAGQILTGRQAIAVWPRTRPGKTKDAAASTAICCAMALEASDVASVASVGDLHLTKLVEQIERTLGGPGHPIPDLAGVSCQAVRTIPLELPDAARRVFDGQPQISWSYPVTPGADPNAPARSGWWQVCVGGAGETEAPACDQGGGACAEASRQMVAALIDPAGAGAGGGAGAGAGAGAGGGAETDRWVSVGTMSPSRWVPIVSLFSQTLARMLPEGVDAAKVFGRLDRIEWRLAARENDDVAGTLRIEMTPPRGAR